MDQEEAPPPYSAVDPLLAPANNNGSGAQASVPLHGNGPASQAQAAGSSRMPRQESASSSAAVPTHFTSAVTYFERRPPAVIDDSRPILHHHMTIYPRSSAKDFPRRPRCWASRMGQVAQEDWNTFLQYLFPPQLGLAAASQHLPRQLRAEIQRDRKDRPQETDEERRARIAAVVEEWNECYFEPRATRIDFVYIGEPDAAPASALCPRCYPAATRASGSVEGQPARNPSVPSPLAGQHTPSPTGWPAPASPFPHSPQYPVPYGPPYGVPPFYAHGTPPNHQPPQYYPPPPPPPPGVAPWQWNNWAHSQPQYGSSGTSKNGALGWISQLTSQAQKYGERFAEQAQQYGDQISAHAMYYGRQVEEQALAHSRWLEEQARFHGRKPSAYPPAGYPIPPSWGPQPQTPNGQTTGVVQNTPPPAGNNTTSPNQPTPSNQGNEKDKFPAETERSLERSRRASISSVSSDSSLSSIDSISTSSDLGASDLATVRAQLQALDDRHDRTLYDAALDLRRQVDVLRDSRREARASGRRGWRPGLLGQQEASRQDSSDWGRWDSPEQQQRQATEQRAMKEEMRATRKAFRDVVRRAREEQREKRRARRSRRRQARPGWSEQNAAKENGPLNARLGNLNLQDSAARPARVYSDPVSPAPHPQQAQPFQPAAPGRSHTSTNLEIGGPNARNTASQASPAPTITSSADVSDRRTRIKEMLKPRTAKKQQQSRADGSGKPPKPP
ncbi:hypothetical protein N7492_010195 [Penicillium capsulatum]|uniref:Uncharacterized protein n=1 Tax=Penicillium capsulatum TaxID=69766 RepID=A0A9W9HNI5_9EURO|nr:hypothetical protein N7492_010195 [Penicillium capsulatum]KAJ6112703.1 hypothetical protein N7512_008027 [Penicillium capsulatum]